MKKLLCLSILICASALAGAQTKPAVNHDGVWWTGKSPSYREAYIVGYKDGMHHILNHDSDLVKFSSVELSAGVDTFYKDFRNRSINVKEALAFVGDQLRGIPDDKLNAELLKMRAAAASTTTNPE
jgi:hypothetical protein